MSLNSTERWPVLLGVIGATSAFALNQYEAHRIRVELDVDVIRVSDIAVRYAARHCHTLPVAPVGIEDAAADIGLSDVSIAHPGRWTLVLTARAGSMGFALEARYAADASEWQVTRLLERHKAVRTATGVSLPLKRRSTSPNQAGFQLLLEQQSC